MWEKKTGSTSIQASQLTREPGYFRWTTHHMGEMGEFCSSGLGPLRVSLLQAKPGATETSFPADTGPRHGNLAREREASSLSANFRTRYSDASTLATLATQANTRGKAN